MSFDRERKCFRLKSLHPDETLEGLIADTGFAFEHDTAPLTTALPEPVALDLIRGPIGDAVAETYPAFAERLRGGAAA
jgi:glutaconate CoA-transferase subunit B